MKKYLPLIALAVLLGALVYGHYANKIDQQLMQGYYRALAPEAAGFKPMNDKVAAALDDSGATLAYVGVSSYVGYGGPILVGVLVRPDGSLGTPLIFQHKETVAYLSRIKQEGFYRQFEKRRADDALMPGFDLDAVSGASLSSRAIALAVNEVAHTVAVQALSLTPKKAELPLQAGVNELVIAALFALSLVASRVKKLAKFRLVLLVLSIGILGFWLNRSFSLAYVQAAFMGFFPSLAQNLLWYIVILGALLPALLLGKNLYCLYVCPFCGVQELTHKISHVNLPVGPLMKIAHALRDLFLFAALFIGFLSLNPSYASYEPFGTIFGLNGERYNWYLLFVMIVASFFFRRFWCNVFCPAGAVLDFIASKRRDAGKALRGRKAGPAAGAPIAPSMATVQPKAQPQAQKTGWTKSQLLFLLFYAAGVVSIAWTVWGNMQLR